MDTSGQPSRRLLLQTLTVTGLCAALPGCTSNGGAAGQPGPSVTSSTPGQGAPLPPASSSEATSHSDVLLVQAAIADEHALLDACLASVAALPDLATALSSITDQQRRHVAVLRAALTGRQSYRRRMPAVGSRRAALHGLRRSLVVAQSDRRDGALAADSGALAQLLASMSASHAVAAGLDALRT